MGSDKFFSFCVQSLLTAIYLPETEGARYFSIIDLSLRTAAKLAIASATLRSWFTSRYSSSFLRA